MHDRALPANCKQGRHRARRVKLVFEGGTLRTKCRDCGCDLVRTEATRQWYFSGRMGADAA